MHSVPLIDEMINLQIGSWDSIYRFAESLPKQKHSSLYRLYCPFIGSSVITVASLRSNRSSEQLVLNAFAYLQVLLCVGLVLVPGDDARVVGLHHGLGRLVGPLRAEHEDLHQEQYINQLIGKYGGIKKCKDIHKQEAKSSEEL